MGSRLEDRKYSTRYAKALFDLADEKKKLDNVQGDLIAFRDLLNEVPDLIPFFMNPAISIEEKNAFLEKQVIGKVGEYVSNMLRLLVENERISIFPLIVERYEELLDERNSVASAEVITAAKLDESLEKKLRKVLESRFGYSEIKLTKRVDASILGGAIVKIQDKIIDGSFSGKLETLKAQYSQ